MPAAPYYRKGITKVFNVPTITVGAPTAVQVNAGAHITAVGILADLAGFSFTSQTVTVPDWGDNWEGKVPGMDQAVDIVLTFNDLRGGGTYPAANPFRASLAKGTATNLVVFPAGIAGATPAAGDYCDVWTVLSTGPHKMFSATENARWQVTLPASIRPTQDVALV